MDQEWWDHQPQGVYLSEQCKEYAREHGAMMPTVAWICTPLDSWEPNPFYTGEPQPHPESLS
jgi:hypothetical protein